MGNPANVASVEDPKGKALSPGSESGERDAREMAVIVEIGRLISSTLEIDEVYERFAAEVRKLIPFDRINVNLNDPGGETFTISYVSGTDIEGRRPGDTVLLAGSISELPCRTRTGLLLHPASEEEILSRFPATTATTTYRAGMRSVIVVPLISRDEVIGTLHFRSAKPNAYTARDLLLAERIGRQIAGAIANAKLFADVERLADEMAIIAEIGRLIGSTLEIDEVYRRFAQKVEKLIPVDWLSVNLINAGEESLTIKYVYGIDVPGRRQGDRVRLAGSLTEMVMHRKESLLLHPANVEEMKTWGLSVTATTTFRTGLMSMIVVPLISRDRMIGTLHFRAKRPNAYTRQDLRLAERIGSQIAGAVAGAELYQELQRTERSLRESQLRFRTIFEQAAVGVAEMELETGRFLTVNRRLCELVGRTDEELLATTFIEITHPDDLHLHLDGMARLAAGTLPSFTLEKRYVRKDGSSVWANITLSPLRTPGEPLRRHILVVEDITERRRIADDLDRHARRLVALNETGAELASELKLDALLQSIVQRALSLIGGIACNCYLHRPETDLLEKVAVAGNPISIGGPFRRRGEGFVGHIWSTNAPFLLNDYGLWEQRIKAYDALPPRSLLGVPIRIGDEFLGVLNVMARVPHAYTREDADVLGMFSTQAAIAIRNAQLYDRMNREIAERRHAEENLKDALDQMESRVRERTIELEETNTALRVLIKKGDTDLHRMEENLQANINQLVTPFLAKLRVSRSDQERLTYLNILEANLSNIVSPFVNRLSAAYRSLTPKEIQIAEMVKQGKRSKEIAQLFGVSVGTVITHRNNIRKKLRLNSRDANLRSHLLSLL